MNQPGKINRVSRAISSFLKKITPVQDKEMTSLTIAVPDEQVHLLELKGKLLELYVKPIVDELHKKTPKGLKYLKEACSK